MCPTLGVIVMVAAMLAGCASAGPQTSLTTANRVVAGLDAEAPLTQSEAQRTWFRRNQDAFYENIDRAQPLARRLSTVNVLAAEQEINSHATAEERKRARNRHVGWLIQASEERCSTFLEVLNETDREGNFLFGSLTTILGGLGAIFTPAATARGLAGAAGISSGLRNEFNSAFFYQRTIQALTKSIRDSRSTMREGIEAKFSTQVDDWPFSVALGNVQRYHDQCSLPMAFANISDTLSRPSESFEAGARRNARERMAIEYGSTCFPPSSAAEARCQSLAKSLKETEKPNP